MSPVCVASPPLSGEATVTGALTVAGVRRRDAGETPAEPTCARPVEPETS